MLRSEEPLDKSPNDTSASSQTRGEKQSGQGELPGLDGLLAYKDMLKNALKAFPEADPNVILEKNIKDLQIDLDKIKKGVVNKRYKSTRMQLDVQEDVVVINVKEAERELNVILTLVRLFKASLNDATRLAAYTRQVSDSREIFLEAMRVALGQFTRVKPLKHRR